MDKTCLICGGELIETRLIHKTRDRFEKHVGIPANGFQRRCVECSNCQSCTNLIKPDNAHLLEKLGEGYYEVDFANSNISEKFKKVMALPAAESDNAQRVQRVSAFLTLWLDVMSINSRNISLLDIGAGTGVFLTKFLQFHLTDKKRKFNAVALEPDATAAEHLRSIGEFKVIESTLEPDKIGEKFRVVTMNKIIEHVATPSQLLHNVSKVLNPTVGLIYAEVPDAATIGRRPPEDNILGSLHHHLYSLKRLTILLENAGFCVLDLGRVVEPSGKITVFGFACSRAAFEIYYRGRI